MFNFYGDILSHLLAAHISLCNNENSRIINYSALVVLKPLSNARLLTALSIGNLTSDKFIHIITYN